MQTQKRPVDLRTRRASATATGMSSTPIKEITEKNLDNTLSLLGGLCALLIPIFPTARTAAEKHGSVPLTPLQSLIGENTVQVVYFAASTGFILALGGISILFGRREAVRKPHGNRLPERFWQLFHFACAAAIALAGIWILVTLKLVDGTAPTGLSLPARPHARSPSAPPGSPRATRFNTYSAKAARRHNQPTDKSRHSYNDALHPTTFAHANRAQINPLQVLDEDESFE
jgi:hypothetical protein